MQPFVHASHQLREWREAALTRRVAGFLEALQNCLSGLRLSFWSLRVRFSGRGLYCRMMIWAAVVVQLHLLLIQDLHHHSPEGQAADSRQTLVLTVDGRAQVQAAQGQGTPLCAACQITRNGSIRLEPPNLAPFQPVELGEVAPLPLFVFHPVSLCPITGRAPPFFS